MASLVAKSYSDALFELAKEVDKVELIKEQLIQIDSVLKEHVELQKILKHPNVEKEDKKEMLVKVFDGMEQYVSSFVRLLIDKNRFSAFSDIVKEYVASFNVLHNIEIAHVRSASALTSDEEQRIKDMLEKKLNKTVQLICKVDASLIAGLIVQVNDDIYDNSVVHRLNKMKNAVNKTAV